MLEQEVITILQQLEQGGACSCECICPGIADAGNPACFYNSGKHDTLCLIEQARDLREHIERAVAEKSKVF